MKSQAIPPLLLVTGSTGLCKAGCVGGWNQLTSLEANRGHCQGGEGTWPRDVLTEAAATVNHWWCARSTLPTLPDAKYVTNASDRTLRMPTINTISMTANARDLLTEATESEPSICRARMHSCKFCHTRLRPSDQDTNTNNHLHLQSTMAAKARDLTKAITLKNHPTLHSRNIGH